MIEAGRLRRPLRRSRAWSARALQLNSGVRRQPFSFDEPSSVSRTRHEQRLALIYSLAGSGLAALIVTLMWSGRRAQRAVIELYGHNTDSGIFEALFAMALTPFTLVFLLAGLGLWQGYRWGRAVHAIGVWAAIFLALCIALVALWVSGLA